MLNLLDVAVDHQTSLRDHRPRKVRGRRPPADPADEEECRSASGEQMQPD
jgi:hypothetical protein